MALRLLRRLKDPSKWAALSDASFRDDVKAHLLETEFNLQGLSVYKAEDNYWAQRVAATMILSSSTHEEFVGAFLDEERLTKTLRLRLDDKVKGAVLDKDVRERHVDLKDFSLSAVRLLFEYILEQFRAGPDSGKLFVMTKAEAVQFLKHQVSKNVALRDVVFSKISNEQHGNYMLKMWRSSDFMIP